MVPLSQSVASKCVFLPGLDGTGLLFDEILPLLTPALKSTVVAYPCKTAASPAELLQRIDASLPENEPYFMLAESFSGPLALRAVGKMRNPPVALILCSSFGCSPVSKTASLVLRLFAASGFSKLPIPKWLIRRYLLGDAPENVILSFRQAMSRLSNRALASRFQVLAGYDHDFVPTSLKLPILYIRALQDRLVHKRDLTWLQHRFPHIRICEVDSPHFVLQARPQQSARLILEFLQEQS